MLLAFAALAGAGTAVSPCVLPVLPAVLSAGIAGGSRRPAGVVLGLAVTFTVTVAGVAGLLRHAGLSATTLRGVAIAVLALAGATLLWPRLRHLMERALAPASRFGPRSHGRGFWSGLAVGSALGLLYVPCAGPILAAVISVGAASAVTLPIALAYSAGTAIVLLALAHGGRRVAVRLRGPSLQRAVGAVLVVTAAAIAAGLDQRAEAQLAARLPGFLVDPTGGIERSAGVQRRLAAIGHGARFRAPAGPRLGVLGTAPDFRGTGRWFNTPGGRPLTLAGLRGRVVLVDFWTYTCINCLRTLPYLDAWDRRYRSQGLVIVGVHTPEFGFEHDAGNVGDAVARLGIRYPVVQDNRYATWNAWGNQAWPSDYLVDARGRVRDARSGEGDYALTEAEIRELLADAGARVGRARATVHGAQSPSAVETPETYLGVARAERFLADVPRPGLHTYPGADPRSIPLDRFALRGTWRIGPQEALAVRAAAIDARVVGRAVYLVLSSRGGRPRSVRVELDGRPVRAAQAGADVHGGRLVVRRQRLYRLVALPRVEEHRLRVRLSPGVAGYAFTFG